MMSVIKNPFFIVPCLIFWGNQILERVFETFIPYVHSYLDDLLAIPVVLGITLQIFRWIHPMKEKFVFTKVQTIIGVVYFAFLFEIFFPFLSPIYTADWYDIIFYAIGTFIFYRWINIPDYSKKSVHI